MRAKPPGAKGNRGESTRIQIQVTSAPKIVILAPSSIGTCFGQFGTYLRGFQSGPIPGTFTRLRSCIVPAEITEPPKISGGQNHKYEGR